MEYWRTLLENPSEEKTMNDFAVAIDKIPKLVFSRTLENVDWKSASIAKENLKDEVLKLKRSRDLVSKDIFVGSLSLIVQLLKLELIDEFQLCLYPMVEGNGLSLFEEINDRIIFKLIKTKSFNSGAVILYYQPK